MDPNIPPAYDEKLVPYGLVLIVGKTTAKTVLYINGTIVPGVQGVRVTAEVGKKRPEVEVLFPDVEVLQHTSFASAVTAAQEALRPWLEPSPPQG